MSGEEVRECVSFRTLARGHRLNIPVRKCTGMLSPPHSHTAFSLPKVTAREERERERGARLCPDQHPTEAKMHRQTLKDSWSAVGMVGDTERTRNVHQMMVTTRVQEGDVRASLDPRAHLHTQRCKERSANGGWMRAREAR
jgi:hypothetical protein